MQMAGDADAESWMAVAAVSVQTRGSSKSPLSSRPPCMMTSSGAGSPPSCVTKTPRRVKTVVRPASARTGIEIRERGKAGKTWPKVVAAGMEGQCNFAVCEEATTWLEAVRTSVGVTAGCTATGSRWVASRAAMYIPVEPESANPDRERIGACAAAKAALAATPGTISDVEEVCGGISGVGRVAREISLLVTTVACIACVMLRCVKLYRAVVPPSRQTILYLCFSAIASIALGDL